MTTKDREIDNPPSELRIRPAQFPPFIRSLVFFSDNSASLVENYSTEFGSADMAQLLTFTPERTRPQIQHILGKSSKRVYDLATERTYSAGDYTDRAERDFQTLQSSIPGLEYRRSSLGIWGFCVNQQLLSPSDPYQFLKTLLLQEVPFGPIAKGILPVIEIPAKFNTAYDSLTTGEWRGRGISKGSPSVTYSGGFTHSGTPSNLIEVTQGDDLDQAFLFFSGLGFFNRTELSEGRAEFSLTGGRVSMETDPRYDGVFVKRSRHSIFGPRCRDQDLLATLRMAYERQNPTVASL